MRWLGDVVRGTETVLRDLWVRRSFRGVHGGHAPTPYQDLSSNLKIITVKLSFVFRKLFRQISHFFVKISLAKESEKDAKFRLFTQNVDFLLFHGLIFQNIYKGIEFVSQTLIFLSLYLSISMSEPLDISNYELF